jgi:hypothetical protein
MPRVIDLNRGSKKRIDQIRWKPLEVISVVLLFLVVSILGVFLAIWSVLSNVD